MNTPQLDIRADAEPEQIEHLGLYRDMSAQILDFEDDLFDPQLRYVEKDIRICRRLTAAAMPAGGALSLRQLGGVQAFIVHTSSSGLRPLPACQPAWKTPRPWIIGPVRPSARPAKPAGREAKDDTVALR